MHKKAKRTSTFHESFLCLVEIQDRYKTNLANKHGLFTSDKWHKQPRFQYSIKSSQVKYNCFINDKAQSSHFKTSYPLLEPLNKTTDRLGKKLAKTRQRLQKQSCTYLDEYPFILYSCKIHKIQGIGPKAPSDRRIKSTADRTSFLSFRSKLRA